MQSFKTLDVLLPSADLKLIETASMQMFDRFWGMSMGDLRQIDHAEMMRFGLQFQELMFEMPFQLPENLLLLGRTVAILSGMCTGMDPRIQPVDLPRAIRQHADLGRRRAELANVAGRGDEDLPGADRLAGAH